MKTVLVTGSTGALGRALISRMEAAGQWRVVVVRRQGKAETEAEAEVDSQPKERHNDQMFSNIESAKPDLILHLAATFVNEFQESYAVNVEAAHVLFDAVQRLGFRTRILLIGSAAEYGVVRPEENPIRPDRVLNPVSIYGLTKAWQTQLAGLHASRGMDVVVARVFNLDGPALSERLFIGRLQKQIAEVLAGRKLVIELGPLDATRDYISTQEAADQILAIAAYGMSGQVYHVASGIPVTMCEILGRYLVSHKLDFSIVRAAADLTNRIGYDVPVIYADVTKTMQLMKVWRASVET